MIPSPVKLPTVPPYRWTTPAARLTNSAMISRNRSAPTAAAIVIEWTTSANSTVTCLYSADRLNCVTGAPHSLQNLEFGGSSVPHDPQSSPVAVSPPPPSRLGSTSVSFHRWSTMSVISPCHLRHEVLRPSNVVCFKTPVFGPYHADLSSLRRLGVLAVAASVLEQLTLAVSGFVVFVTGMIAVVAHHETATLSSHCYRNKKPQG